MESIMKRKSKGKGKALKNKRKRKPSQSEDESPAYFSSKYAEPPVSKIYNTRIINHAPAELFRKDLISAMKLPDSEPLDMSDYIVIEDGWKPEWERGVQVPVDPDSLPEPNVRQIRKRNKNSTFRLHKKLLRTTQDAFFSPEVHSLSFTSVHAEEVCRYDMDDADLNFLQMINEDREDFGLQPIDEDTMERIMDEIENIWLENFRDALRTEGGIGDADDDAICDVCRSPDSEEGNEIVFCDACNMCVHQSCYGIVKIPVGSWICRTCALNVRPPCLFCPARGGAMKPTINGEEWCHVSCAIWMPEVSFLHVEKMEPITKVHLVPATRWALACSLCSEKVGACIQCSFKNCKVAYHVTCAVREGLKMRAIMRDDDDALKLKSFCRKHSKETAVSVSESDSEDGNKNEMNFNDEVAYNIREEKIHEKESNFFNYVTADEIAEIFQYDKDIVEPVFNYWKLKRRANFNHPLLPPKEVSSTKPSVQEHYLYTFIKNLVRVRRDLERARNLCYMVIKRDKLTGRWVTAKRDIFLKQMELLKSDSIKFSKEECKAILRANQGDLVYDKIHSGQNGPTPNTLAVLNGLIGEENTRTQLNWILKTSKKQEMNQSKKMPNPYAKHYLNGLLKRSQRWLATVDRNKQENIYREKEEERSHGENELSVASTSDHGRTENNDSNYKTDNLSLSDCDHLFTPNQELENDSKNIALKECDVLDEISFQEHDNTSEIVVNTDLDTEWKSPVAKTFVFDLQEIKSEGNNVNNCGAIKLEKNDSVLSSIKLEKTDEDSDLFPIKLVKNGENSDLPPIKLEKNGEDGDSFPIKLEKSWESNDSWSMSIEYTEHGSSGINMKEEQNYGKNDSESYKHISAGEDRIRSLKTRGRCHGKLEKKKCKLKKKKKQDLALVTTNVDSNSSETVSLTYGIDRYNCSERSFASEETSSLETDINSCGLVSDPVLNKNEGEACHMSGILKENVPIINKSKRDVNLNFSEVKLQLPELSDTDTNDSIQQGEMNSPRNKQSILIDSDDTSSVKTVISTPEIQVCDQLNLEGTSVKCETVALSPYQNETSNTSATSIQNSECLPNNKHKLVEHIMKESKEQTSNNSFPNVSVPRKGSLTGYKIPKKIKPDPAQNSLEHKRGNLPLSPLTDRTSSSTTTSSYSNNKNYKTWQKSHWKIMRSRKTASPDPSIPSAPLVEKPKPFVDGEIESRRVVNRNEFPPRSGWAPMSFGNPHRNDVSYWGQPDLPRFPLAFHNNHFPRGPPVRPWLHGRGLYHPNMSRMPFGSAPNT